MKKGLMFLVLFLLIIAGVYLYKKNPQSPLKVSPQNQKVTLSPAMEKKEEATFEKNPQGLTLEVYEPKDKAVVNNSNLTVKGKTSPLTEVFVNEKELKADSQGNFATILTLDEGENVIMIAASDSYGNYAEKELMVTLETVE